MAAGRAALGAAHGEIRLEEKATGALIGRAKTFSRAIIWHRVLTFP